MENYEINILKSNGDWKKYNHEAISDSKENPNSKKSPDYDKSLDKKTKTNTNGHDDLLSSINKVNLIANKLENLENEKNDLKSELKKFEKIFLTQKILSEKKLSQVSKEVEMFNKSLEVIKNLKEF